MGRKADDLTGKRFGRLTVIKRVEDKITPNGTHKAMYLCKCSCGNEKIIEGQSLHYNKTRSCGCYSKEKASLRFKKHGMNRTKEYSTWYGIKTRCFNENFDGFKNYGGRGITMCKEWKEDFLAFYNYVSKLPHAFEYGYSIDRINNNGNYEPGNIRWATCQEQNYNKRNCIYYDFCGKKYTTNQIFQAIGVPIRTIRWRHQNGKDLLNEREMLRFVEYLKNMEERNGVKS